LPNSNLTKMGQTENLKARLWYRIIERRAGVLRLSGWFFPRPVSQPQGENIEPDSGSQNY
ncbi:MAG: hypothetical protein WAV38_17620, partial [Xanthobacteraceae bacterium]